MTHHSYRYPDFPRVDCILGICTIAFEGTNILTYNLLKKVRSLRYVGLIMVDFPGDGLIQAVIDLNKKHLLDSDIKPIWTSLNVAILVTAIFVLSLIVAVSLYFMIQSLSGTSWMNKNLSLNQIKSVKPSVQPYQRMI